MVKSFKKATANYLPQHSQPLLQHVYRSRIPSAESLLSQFQAAHPAPRPSLLYLPEASPPVTVCSVRHANLLFLAPSTSDTDPLLILEFIHRTIDIFEDFLGAPLLSHKIENNYDVIAQLLVEMCDAGIVCNTESNALHENVEIEGFLGKLLGGINLPTGPTPGLGGGSNPLKQSLSASAASAMAGPAIPWRRSGVRHTSNELYVDIVEELNVTLAPSGRPLTAIASGSIAFTAKISGVPDLILSLSASGGRAGIARTLELPVFHPCVRLGRWKEKPGELSFIPPDGRFILAGYESNLLPALVDDDKPPSDYEKLFLPATVDLVPSLGASGNEFEVRLTLNTNFPGSTSSSNRPGTQSRGSGTSTPSFLGSMGASSSGGSSSSPSLETVSVAVPIPKSVRSITDIQPSRGDATFMPGSDYLEWKVPTKGEGSVTGTATLRCTLVGHASTLDDEDDEEDMDEFADSTAVAVRNNNTQMLSYYDDTTTYPESYQQQVAPGSEAKKKKKKKKKGTSSEKEKGKGKAKTVVSDIAAAATNTASSSSAASPLSSTPTASSSFFQNPPSQSQPQSQPQSQVQPPSQRATVSSAAKKRIQKNKALMPSSVSVSFSVKGWLPSGIRVESLVVDQRKSRGLGEGVKPYKGVKYVCVSRRGVEKRC